jgi:hypothetical protein
MNQKSRESELLARSGGRSRRFLLERLDGRLPFFSFASGGRDAAARSSAATLDV